MVTRQPDGSAITPSHPGTLVVDPEDVNDFAIKTDAQTGVAATADIAGLALDFTVGNRPKWVIGIVPFAFCTTAPGQALLAIADMAGVAKATAGVPPRPLVSDRTNAIVVEEISVPGSYQRKLRWIRNSGTWTLSARCGDSNSVLHIRSTLLGRMRVTTRTSTGLGRIVSGIGDTLFYREPGEEGLAPVVYHHGAQQNHFEPTRLPVRKILRAFARRGHPIACVTGALQWGNSTYQARAALVRAYLRDEMGAEGPAIGIGASHGANCNLTDAAENPEEFACVIGIIPVTDLQSIRVGNINGLGASVDTAWGVVYPAALPAGADPISRTGDFDLPIQLWISSNDMTALATSANTFGQAVGAEIHDLGALGHTDAAIAAVDPEAVYKFARQALINA